MLRIKYLTKTIIRIFYYLLSSEKRYLNLLILILIYRPKKILEIGVYNGRRSLQMIEAAKVFNNDIFYYGFDLFESTNKNIIKSEKSKKPSTKNDISKILNRHTHVSLFKGFTKHTLKKFAKKNKASIDLAFIDGGHKVETIECDYYYCKKICKNKSIIVFDDFYLLNKPDTKKFGSNKLFFKLKDTQKVKLLPFIDKYKKNDQKIHIKMFFVRNNT